MLARCVSDGKLPLGRQIELIRIAFLPAGLKGLALLR
jgi:hypothetical protein